MVNLGAGSRVCSRDAQRLADSQPDLTNMFKLGLPALAASISDVCRTQALSHAATDQCSPPRLADVSRTGQPISNLSPLACNARLWHSVNMNDDKKERDLVNILWSLTSNEDALNSFLDSLDIDEIAKLASASLRLYEAAEVWLQ
jgi:hypothetical protein